MPTAMEGQRARTHDSDAALLRLQILIALVLLSQAVLLAAPSSTGASPPAGASPPTVASQVACPEPDAPSKLGYGQFADGCSIDEAGARVTFKFGARKGDVARIIVARESSSLEPRIEIHDAKGRLLHDGTEAVIEPSDFNVAPAPSLQKGRYHVTVSALDGVGTGNYSFALVCRTGPCEKRADPATPLVYYEAFDGFMTRSTETHFFSFSGEPGTTIRLTTTTPVRSSIFARIELYGPDGELIGDSSSSHLMAFDTVVEKRDAYTAILSSYNANRSGEYTLALSCLVGPCDRDADGRVDDEAPLLEYGNEIIDEIDDGTDIDMYRFPAEAGTLVRFIARDSNSNGEFERADLRVRMQFWDPNGVRLPDNLFVTYFFLPIRASVDATVSGAYTVAVHDLGGEAGGEYSLAMECIAGPCDRDRDGIVDPVPAGPAYDQSIDGEISPGSEVDIYSFEGTAGTEVRPILLSTGFVGFGGPGVQVFAPDGTFVEQPCCQGSRRSDLILTQTGRYTVSVSSFFGLSSGSYTLALACIVGPCDSDGDGTPDPEPPPLEDSVEVADSIDSVTDIDSYRFEADAGTVIRLSLLRTTTSAGDFRPTVELRDPNGVIRTQDLSGPIEPRHFNRGLPEADTLDTSGIWTATISAEDYEGTGDYTIQIECIAGPCDRDRDGVVDPLPPRIGFDHTVFGDITEPGAQDYYHLEGTPGTEIYRTIQPYAFDRIALYSPSGKFLERFRLNNLIEVTESGPYIVQVSDPGPYALAFTCAFGPCDSDDDGVLDPEPAPLEYDAPILAALDTYIDIDSYQFEADAGTQIRVFVGPSMNEQALQLVLKDPSGARLWGHFSSSSPSTPVPSSNRPITVRPADFRRNHPITLDTTGTYTMGVHSRYAATGVYAVALHCISGPCDRDRDGMVDGPAPAIGFGQTLSRGLANRSQMHRYSFEGRAGTQVRLLAETPDPSQLFAQVELYGPDGTLVGVDVPFGVPANALLDSTLEQTGTHTVVVSTYNVSSMGAYTLSLSCLSAGGCL